MKARLERFQVLDEVHGRVPCTVLVPPGAVAGSTPLCLFLYGGGGSAELLALLRARFERWWTSGALPPLMLATPGVDPFCFYLDDPARGMAWETFVADRFLAQVRERFQPAARTALVGISMGGYGALRIAFARASAYSAVAAVSPMLEPAFEADQVRPRNRFFYPPVVPQALVGAGRDPGLYRVDTPVARARRHAEALQGAALGIYIDAAGDDALCAHDGAEFLHRVLWDLDIAHDYRLRDGSDHAGPDEQVRMLDAFNWAAQRLDPKPAEPLSDLERAWASFLDGDRAEPPSAALDPSSRVFPRLLRAQVSEARRSAQQLNPSLARRYGKLPSVDGTSDARGAHAAYGSGMPAGGVAGGGT